MFSQTRASTSHRSGVAEAAKSAQVASSAAKAARSRSVSNHALQQLMAPRVQPKLTINEPGDRFEQEADGVAADVMRMKAPGPAVSTVGRLSSVQRMCSPCSEEKDGVSPIQRAGSGCGKEQDQNDEDKAPNLQRASGSDRRTSEDQDTASYIDSLQGGDC